MSQLQVEVAVAAAGSIFLELISPNIIGMIFRRWNKLFTLWDSIIQLTSITHPTKPNSPNGWPFVFCEEKISLKNIMKAVLQIRVGGLKLILVI